jgi:hypothetical protein
MINSITTNHLSQLQLLIKRLSDEQLAERLAILGGSSLGKHVRHILEFYICLCDSLETGKLNYDLRKRDKEMETSTKKCLHIITGILVTLDQYDTDFPMKLYADYSVSEENGKITLDTTFYRELLYNGEHIVHHLAIIRIGMASKENFIEIEENMGVAASTIRNKNICAP